MAGPLKNNFFAASLGQNYWLKPLRNYNILLEYHSLGRQEKGLSNLILAISFDNETKL